MASTIDRGELRQSGFSPTAPSLDTNTIARLPVRFIADMSRDDLIRVIRAAQLPLIDVRMVRRLPFIDRAALERLAHLARRCCRRTLRVPEVFSADDQSEERALT